MSEPANGNPITFLHVEDDRNDVYFVGKAFSKAAPEAVVHVVRDGEEARAYLAGEPPFADRSAHPLPALVLLDLKLPRMNGLEVLEWMKGQPALKDIPVVFLSSSTDRTDVDRAYELGACAYVSKQGDLKKLLELVRGIVAFTAAREA